jgi:hypothetical protein
MRLLATLLLISTLAHAQSHIRSDFRVEVPKCDEDGIPLKAARICFSKTKCFAPPTQNPPFGLNPKAKEIKTSSGKRLVLFTAQSWGGGSGSLSYIALLDPSARELSNLLPDVKITNQSDLNLWSLRSISPMPLVATADFLWEEGETHFSAHKYFVRVFLYNANENRYGLADSFTTSKKYAGLDDVDKITVLNSEKANILERLKRRDIRARK